jgi:hypothetical protein
MRPDNSDRCNQLNTNCLLSPGSESLCLDTTMPSSESRSSTKSPIGAVPYDVLLDIFVHCLPQDRLEIRQPNTSIAPVLLCHICSSWRTVALAAPILWSHLLYRVPVWEMDDYPGRWALLEREIEFIRWWKKNQGLIAPFLRLDIERHDDESRTPLPIMALVMDLGPTAQHLEIDPTIWERVQTRELSWTYDTFPNLHTLVMYPSGYPIDHCFWHTFPLLRRLAIVEDDTFLNDTTIPAQWSTLTHLSITTVYISPDFWVSLTSAVPCLQWAYIGFQDRFEEDKYINPIKRTLPQLSTLFIESGAHDDCSISPLFIGLHLPALNYLFLSSFVRAWWDHRGMADVAAVLQSAPALRNLTLRKCDYLSPTEIVYAMGSVLGPIWNCSPHLAHLQLELLIRRTRSESEVEQELDSFARGFFFSNRNRWLDLDNSACPIKTLTIASPSYLFDSNAQVKTSSIRNVGNASNIALQVIAEPSTDFEHCWKEWRLGN